MRVIIAGTIPIKTPLGQAELAARKRSVSQRHRTVLFLVDGRRSAAEVRSMALQAGVPDHCFDELVTQGLIMLPEPTLPLQIPAPLAAPAVLQVDVPLPDPVPAAVLASVPAGAIAAAPDSLLPPSRTLHPESVSADSVLGDASPADSWLPSDNEEDPLDPDFSEARLILLRAVRAEAPLAGSLTLMRLRRARTRAELVPLLDEVENRISKPHRSLAATQTMARVRHLLDGRRIDSTLSSA
jgi:hypothetical protein